MNKRAKSGKVLATFECSEAERVALRALAKRRGMSFGDLVLGLLNEAEPPAREPFEPVPPKRVKHAVGYRPPQSAAEEAFQVRPPIDAKGMLAPPPDKEPPPF